MDLLYYIIKYWYD